MNNLEWNVYRFDMNTGKSAVFNIFWNRGFLRDCANTYKEFPDDKAAFSESIKKHLRYYFWAKCEYELIMSPWPPVKDVGEKIDVFSQVMNNWQRFIDYLWINKDALSQ